MTTTASQTASPADASNGWTPADLARARRALESQISRLRRNIADAETNNGPQVRQTTADDKDNIYAATLIADVGAGSQMVDNSDAILEQCERALRRIHDGTYGICDECAHPIIKDRLLAIPRATRCAPCQ